MTANTMREAFEEHAYYWARSLTVVDGEYCDDEVNSAWLYFKAGAAWQAAQSAPVEDVVLPIASAYESGVGHCNDSLCNPYKAGSAEAYAYDYGKEFGKSRATEHSVGDAIPQDWKGVDGAIAWHLIDRHGEGWGHIGDLMNAWLRANTTQSVPVVGEPSDRQLFNIAFNLSAEFGPEFTQANKAFAMAVIEQYRHAMSGDSIPATELERLRKDAERLEWLDSHVRLLTKNWDWVGPVGFRQAIDAQMRLTEKEANRVAAMKERQK